MSLLKLNKLFRLKNQNEKGFSLVELMIAVGILSAVSFGIFKSFQVGFWGMSDARARTIATNLAQEKLEEVKGKALVNGTFPDPDNPIRLSGKDFNVVFKVEDADPGSPPLPPQLTYSVLKKIVTTVSWQKRNGTETEIKVEGLQSRTELFSKDTPFSILLSIDPKNGMITIGEEAEITVTILDQDNYPIPFKGIIQLTMVPSNLGTLDDELLHFDGETSYLKTKFIANTEGNAGSVVVTARDVLKKLIHDSEEIIITGGEPKKIYLEAEPDSILINGEKSSITIKILDEHDYLSENWTGEIELKFVPGGNTGYLGENSALGDPIYIEFKDENTKTVEFISSMQEGKVKIKAIDRGEELADSDILIINVNSGPPFKILVEADPNNVIINETSNITITILNETGIPVSGFKGTISLSVISGSASGSLSDTELSFNGQEYLTTTFKAKTVPGVVEIEAKDTKLTNFLKADKETITVAIGPPTAIKIDAKPNMIFNDGIDVSSITTTFVDSGGNQSSFNENKILNLSIDPIRGILSKEEITLPAGRSTNTDIPVTYSCNDKNFDGNVKIIVNCPGIDEASTIVQVVSRIVKPIESIRYGITRNWDWRIWDWVETENRTKILFEIEVLGGTIAISQINLAWKGGNAKEKLSEIRIYDKGITSNVRIRKTWSPSSNYQLVKVYSPPTSMDMLEIKSFNTKQDLAVREYTVELQFDTDVVNRTILIQFYGSYQGKTYIYEMEFLSPDLIV